MDDDHKQAIDEMREAYWAYSAARQRRYDQLATWNPLDEDALEKHNAVVEQLDNEQFAVKGKLGGPLNFTVSALMDRDTYELHIWRRGIGFVQSEKPNDSKSSN